MPPPRRIAGLLAGAALAAVPVLPAAAGPAPAHRTFVVTLRQLTFGPLPAQARVGDVIQWANDDMFLHSATARDRSFDIELKPKARVNMPLTKAGTFDFICRYHPGMTGRLVVGR